MSTVIICCSGLTDALQAAQETMHTNHPVIEIDRIHHRDPNEMHHVFLEALNRIPADIETILVAQGFCGGALDQVTAPCQMVIPRLDDCITIAMQETDAYQPNLKETGHMYIAEPDPVLFSPANMLRTLTEQMGEEFGKITFDAWFANYHWLDVVDTGLYDCYDEAFVTRMQAEADLFDAELNFIPGGNRILEKLVSGRWDEQFVVLEKGQTTSHGLFF